jgi:hypothetical protein
LDISAGSHCCVRTTSQPKKAFPVLATLMKSDFQVASKLNGMHGIITMKA